MAEMLRFNQEIDSKTIEMMKTLTATLLLFMAVALGASAFGQTSSASADKAPKSKKAAKASKRKEKAADAVATPAPSAESAKPSAPASVTLTPAPAPAPTPTPAPSPSPAPSPAPEQAPAAPLTTIGIEAPDHDFGEIKEGDVVKHTFRITNTGTNPLILENVKPSCGCTALDYPKEPIAPGKSADITAQFNSLGKAGDQLKYITITCNTANRIERLSFKGKVIPKPVEGTAPAAPAGGH